MYSPWRPQLQLLAAACWRRAQQAGQHPAGIAPSNQLHRSAKVCRVVSQPRLVALADLLEGQRPNLSWPKDCQIAAWSAKHGFVVTTRDCRYRQEACDVRRVGGGLPLGRVCTVLPVC